MEHTFAGTKAIWKAGNKVNLLILVNILVPRSGSGSAFPIRIRIQESKQMRIRIWNTASKPESCDLRSFFAFIFSLNGWTVGKFNLYLCVGRVMLGETNPADSKPGTIRGDFCVQVCTLNVSDPNPLFPESGSALSWIRIQCDAGWDEPGRKQAWYHQGRLLRPGNILVLYIFCQAFGLIRIRIQAGAESGSIPDSGQIRIQAKVFMINFLLSDRRLGLFNRFDLWDGGFSWSLNAL